MKLHYRRYSLTRGVEKIKTRTAVVLSAATLMIGGGGGIALALQSTAHAAAPTVSSNANSNACFGQARASYAKGGPNGVLAPYNNGHYISQRKGDNPSNNAAYIAANCPSDQYTASSTTLDACGYFVGTQTPTKVTTHTANGVTYTTESGTWTGVDNNYNNGPVSSLGTVSGTYTETTSKNAAGDVTGTEHFESSSGTIDQTFSYGPDVTGGYSVTVTATGDLAFLTSSTAGECYAGAFPRP